ncbi:16S rRNA (guanine(527)-N(7))-methyltransferase RsmG [Parasulfitobacter algicola]|uniref:Ribosomal RNA small subunit methyltransferase G n=1 Tax=Parasulfitobacter algicola TaxID=2614809 RepID=A0ABX2IL46_9RHOB|nr:16S rRNA (guanine(527)-N(7))-methyltransferase RsmG [Sulfitobacter algicola]NSX53577.1 16S rRNA (guanine(527)-N(7))-methyltransferase RsmG [Sulfitobacter algicola]
MSNNFSTVERFNVSRETFDKLKIYEDLTKKWNPHINLVSKNTLNSMWNRHILDALQLVDYVDASTNKYSDLGSGGGFPGMVLAIIFSEQSPSTETILVESDKRKAEFLRTVSRELEVEVKVIAERIEEIPDLKANLITARALAPLDRLLSFVYRHLNADGIALLPKGNSYQDEITAAKKNWRFDLEVKPSMTSTDATILKIGALSRV